MSVGHRRTLTDSTGVTRDTIDAASSKLLVRTAPGGVKTYYIYGLGLLYEANATGETKTYHFDQVGSTIARTDDAGKLIGQADYSAYGITFWKTGDMATPFLYNGQAGVQTDSNGLLNMRARYYSPYLMRFLNADPSGFSGGSNWFAYADGNPISKNDPFGLCAEGGRSPWDPLNGRQEFALYRNRDGGFTDQWGQNHASACMACHAYTPEAQRNMQGSLYGNLGWARTGAYLGEAMIGLGVEASLVSGTRMAVTSEMSLAQRILSAERTGSGLKADASHSAASFLSEAQLERGTSFTIKGGDDVVREFLQTPGGMNGKSGIFEYILDPTKGVTHQRFIPGGGITGTPNQIVPR